MDFTKCNSDQLWDLVEGRAAARKGEPFNPHQSDWWQAGFLMWVEDHSIPGSREPITTGLMPPTTVSAV